MNVLEKVKTNLSVSIEFLTMAEVVFVEAIPTWHLEVAGENVLWLLY